MMDARNRDILSGIDDLAVKHYVAKVESLFLGIDNTVQDAIACIDSSGNAGIALIVDDEGRLLNTLTEGDVRRGLLAGVEPADTITVLVAVKAGSRLPLPVTSPLGADPTTLIGLMSSNRIRQVPIVTHEGRVVDLATLADLLPEQPRALQAVVMAGGFGTRLRPLTEHIPKPMLPVGGRPLIELIIHQLRNTGIHKVNITTHYQADKIVDHFGSGEQFGVDISYVREENPLGTAGALRLMERPSEPMLVLNGDVLTDVDFRSLHCYHQDRNAMLTVAVRRYDVQVPYGVVDTEGALVREIREKPQLTFFVNAGIYLLEPSVYDYIPPNQHFNMTDLIQTLLNDGRTVASFPLREYWLDIGQRDDYERAQMDIEKGNWRWTGTAG